MISLLYVDITEFFLMIFNSILDILYELFVLLDSITLLDGSRLGLDFTATLLDFQVGAIVIGIVVGAFIRLNKADNYYYQSR